MMASSSTRCMSVGRLKVAMFVSTRVVKLLITLNKEWSRSSSKDQKRTGVEEVRVAGLAVVGLNKIESLEDARALLLRRCRPV